MIIIKNLILSLWIYQTILVSNSKNCSVHAPHTKCKKCDVRSVHTQCAVYSNSVSLQSVSCNRQMVFLKVRIINYAYNLHTTCSSRTFSNLSLARSRTSHMFFFFFVVFTTYISRALSLSLSFCVFCLHFSVFLLFFFRIFSFLEDPIYNPHIISHKD